jgi:hypothetical protein
MFTENLDIFLRDFGQSIILHLPAGDRTITAIFDNAFFDAAVGQTVLDTTQPRFESKTSDLAGLAREMTVTVAGTVYSVQQIQPDGNGILDVRLDPRVVGELIAAESATTREVSAAIKRAVARTCKWANEQVSRRVAKVTKLSAKIIKGRNAVFLNSDLGKVWVGLDPVSLHRLNPIQDATGVTAGPAKVPGAFIVKSGKLEGLVFKRKDKGRLPVELQKYAIAETANPVIEKIAAEVGERLQTEFASELKWQTKIR